MTACAKGTLAEHVRNVRQKAGLNRVILSVGWHRFAAILAYEMEGRGGQVVTVPARFTSQTCAPCGVVDARSRGSQARFSALAACYRIPGRPRACLMACRIAGGEELALDQCPIASRA